MKIEFGVECLDQIGLHWLGYSAAIGLEILGLKKFVGMVIQASFSFFWWHCELVLSILRPRLGGGEWNVMERNKKNNFKIFFLSLVWEF